MSSSRNGSSFPRVTTTILQVHTDEVWNIEWSHGGFYLASASRDKSAIIWRTAVRIIYLSIFISKLTDTRSKSSAAHEADPHQDWTPHFILRDHPDPVACLAWSKDDSVLLTSADSYIKL